MELELSKKDSNSAIVHYRTHHSTAQHSSTAAHTHGNRFPYFRVKAISGPKKNPRTYRFQTSNFELPLLPASCCFQLSVLLCELWAVRLTVADSPANLAIVCVTVGDHLGHWEGLISFTWHRCSLLVIGQFCNILRNFIHWVYHSI